MIHTIDSAWNLVLEARKNLRGWCLEEKNKYLFDLTYNTNPSLIVEIGVYEGLSLCSFSAASLLLNDCNVIAIDSYNVEDINKDDKTEPVYVNQNDLDMAKNKMLYEFDRLNLPVKLIKKSSIDAYAESCFINNSIDILHIDASHTEESSVLDTLLWMPRVKSTGFIIYDDANRNKLELAQKFALKKCKYIDTIEYGKTTIFQKL